MRIDLLEKTLGITFDLIAFDANGPLIPNVPDECPAWVFNGLAGGNTFPRNKMVNFAGDWIAAMSKYGVDKSDKKILAEISRRRFEHDKALIVMFHWVPQVIAELAKTRKLAIVTDASQEMLEHALPEAVLKKFDAIVTYERLRDLELKLKPAPDGLLLACGDVGVDPSRTLYIGDRHKDLQAAKGANTRYIIAPEGAHHALFGIE